MAAAFVGSLPAYDKSTEGATYEMAVTVNFAANGIKEPGDNSQDPDR